MWYTDWKTFLFGLPQLNPSQTNSSANAVGSGPRQPDPAYSTPHGGDLSSNVAASSANAVGSVLRQPDPAYSTPHGGDLSSSVAASSANAVGSVLRQPDPAYSTPHGGDLSSSVAASSANAVGSGPRQPDPAYSTPHGGGLSSNKISQDTYSMKLGPVFTATISRDNNVRYSDKMPGPSTFRLLLSNIVQHMFKQEMEALRVQIENKTTNFSLTQNDGPSSSDNSGLSSNC